MLLLFVEEPYDLLAPFLPLVIVHMDDTGTMYDRQGVRECYDVW